MGISKFFQCLRSLSIVSNNWNCLRWLQPPLYINVLVTWGTSFLCSIYPHDELYLCCCLPLCLRLSESSCSLTVDWKLDWPGPACVSLLLSWICFSRWFFFKNNPLHCLWAYFSEPSSQFRKCIMSLYPWSTFS